MATSHAQPISHSQSVYQLRHPINMVTIIIGETIIRVIVTFVVKRQMAILRSQSVKSSLKKDLVTLPIHSGRQSISQSDLSPNPYHYDSKNGIM